MNAGPRIPWPIVVGLVGLCAIGWVQGLRTAALRSESLEPGRAGVLLPLQGDPGEEITEISATERFLLLDTEATGAGRLALYEWLPGRPLLRWLEDASSPRPRWVVIPLEGLEDSEFAVCEAIHDAAVGPREMDLPAERLDVVARFRLVPGTDFGD